MNWFSSVPSFVLWEQQRPQNVFDYPLNPLRQHSVFSPGFSKTTSICRAFSSQFKKKKNLEKLPVVPCTAFWPVHTGSTLSYIPYSYFLFLSLNSSLKTSSILCFFPSVVRFSRTVTNIATCCFAISSHSVFSFWILLTHSFNLLHLLSRKLLTMTSASARKCNIMRFSMHIQPAQGKPALVHANWRDHTSWNLSQTVCWYFTKCNLYNPLVFRKRKTTINHTGLQIIEATRMAFTVNQS